MKNIYKIIGLLIVALFSVAHAHAQSSTTAMNSTLIPQAWSNRPIVRGTDVKGGLHELGNLTVTTTVSAAINLLTGNTQLPESKRTEGMVVTFTVNGGTVYRQAILMDEAGAGAADDVWAEIAVSTAWQANTAYTAGDAVEYLGATYFKIADGNSGATFTPALWFGIDNAGNANLNSVTTVGDATIGGNVDATGDVIVGGNLELTDGNTADAIAVDGAAINGTSQTELVSENALVEYVQDQLDAIITDGTADNQILVWNSTSSTWEPAANITINRTTGEIITSGDVSGANIDASGALTGTTLGVGTNNTEFTVDASGNVDAAGTLNAGGLITAEAGLTVSAGQDFTLGGVAVNDIDEDLSDATNAATSLVTAAAVKAALDDIDAQVADGTANQTLRWDATANAGAGAWVGNDALTNDGTDVTATGTVNANALNTTEFAVDASGNVTTTGTLNADGAATLGSTLDVTSSATIGNGLTVTAGGATVTAGGLTVTAGGANINGAVTLADAGEATTVEGTLSVAEAATLGSTLTMDDYAKTGTVEVSGISEDLTTVDAADPRLVTDVAVKTYVDDQLGTGGSLYYGSGTYAAVSTLANNAAVTAGTAIDKADIATAAAVALNNDEYFYIAVPTNWGALNMFIEQSPLIDGFIKQVVGDYNVYVFQFAVPGAATAGLTFAIK